MYLGHCLLAFSLAVLLARWRGLDRRRTLLVGVGGGLFGAVPDVDMWHTAYVVARAGPTNVFPTTEYVWPNSWVVHRTLTHSLVTGGLVVLVVALFAVARRDREEAPRRRMVGSVGAGALLVTSLVAVSLPTDELLGTVTMALFVAAALAVARWLLVRGVGATWVAGAAAVGILSHPFGDLWMGTPPAFLYPLSADPPIERVYFAADPTFNLLTAFGLEVALGCLAVIAALRTTGRPIREVIHPASALGLAYASAAAFVPPPTFRLAYGFAAGLVLVGAAVGLLAVAHRVPSPRTRQGDALATWAATATVTALCCLIGYAVAYGLVLV